MFEILTAISNVEPPNPNMLGGQVLFDMNGAWNWVVPDDVYEICCVCIGAGGGRFKQWTSGGGGGLSWTNHISVTPGETLQIQVGVSANGTTATRLSYVKRDSTYLCLAYGGGAGSVAGGKGGKEAGEFNDGGGNGGNGRNAGTNGIGAGGAGGYSGNGSDGSTNGSATLSGKGGAGSGGIGYNGRVVMNGNGGGTLPYGEYSSGKGKPAIIGKPTASTPELSVGNQGSVPNKSVVTSTQYGGGGGMSNTGGDGCVRIIWGEDRYYPKKNTHDVTGHL